MSNNAILGSNRPKTIVASTPKAALAKLGPLSTEELGLEVVRRKGMNPEDKVLVDAITHRLVQSIQATMGNVEMIGKRGGGLYLAVAEGKLGQAEDPAEFKSRLFRRNFRQNADIEPVEGIVFLIQKVPD